MPALLPIFKKAYWSLAAAGLLYAVFVTFLCNSWVQRHALYAHKLHSGFYHDVSIPESFGFAKNQVTPFNITTPDGETLYSWHVLPLSVYAKHEAEILNQPAGPVSDFKQSTAFKLLTSDPQSRLIINFHGNAGHVAQGWRTDTYRSLSSLPNTHILTADYRGFGRSTGTPSETGLITDGISLARFALSLGIPAHRIVILGQSLGTAVASAVGEVGEGEPAEFAGIVLVAPFTSLPKLLTTYRIFGLIPVLSPLRYYPRIQARVLAYIVDTWDTASRIGSLVRCYAAEGRGRLRLHILHARNDFDIPWRQGSDLFFTAANASSAADGGVTKAEFEERKEVVEKGEGGRTEVWKFGEGSTVIFEFLRHGGHNRVVTYSPVALAALRAFEAAEGRIKGE
ncbi:hypothetical protein W97_01784 [Coniosporium apollinis CBS 100218]|uniref:AB hydrolase-1 domain-containing protein n=1 Tax=Coniosporium apollinis (strain CBS 100218) TaxID=1168221 RepID=R7YKZ0_CONA1|nr:uncharacterized protein W97_01784 [Coniosporium apollinis CBS 100218]EON62560.1 hypothetical protein W97_01784 [Coniosporium apollinis CBS 100218]